MCRVCVPGFDGNFRDGEGRTAKHARCMLHTKLLNIFRKAHAGVIMENSAHLAFAVAEKGRQFPQGKRQIVGLQVVQDVDEVSLRLCVSWVGDKYILLMIPNQQKKQHGNVQICEFLLMAAELMVFAEKLVNRFQHFFIISGVE